MEVFTDQRLGATPLPAKILSGLQYVTHAGLVYCIDYLDSNLDWLQEKLELIQTSRERHKHSGFRLMSNKVMCKHRYYHLCPI